MPFSAALRLSSLALFIAFAAEAAPDEPKRITILYDAFGSASELRKDWGFAALVEYGGRSVLFDTGNNAEKFAHNVRLLGVDLTRLDAAVISHRHGDHTSGLAHLIATNPGVKIYAPVEPAYFGGPTPPAFWTRAHGLPESLRYFDGRDPGALPTGSPWPSGKFSLVRESTEILPGFHVVPTRSENPGTLEMNELSLAVRTPRGLAVIVGCSHPGVERILAGVAKIDSRLYTISGGFHLVLAPEGEVRRVAAALHDELRVERVAPGHCTSELGFSVLLERFGERFDVAGVGATIPLP